MKFFIVKNKNRNIFYFRDSIKTKKENVRKLKLAIQKDMNEILRSRQTFKHKKISDTLRLNHKLTVDN
jgi:hypothetical protein